MKSQLIRASLISMTVITATIGAFANINPSIASYANICPSGEESIPTKLRISAETKDFYVNICKRLDTSSGSYYVARAKNGKGGDAFIPLSIDKKGLYSAVKNKYTYTLDLNKKSLSVYKGNKLILNQRVLKVNYF
jgi:hypothetical protein